MSACTRSQRDYEIDGKDYYFLSVDEFRNRIANEEFAEWEEVYAGNYYGTLKAEIERLWAEGKCVLFDVDVKGGLKLKEAYGDQALSIFVKVSSEEELKRRLNARGTETEETLAVRMSKAQYELSFQEEFDVILVNDDLEQTFPKAEATALDFLNAQ